MRHRSGKKKLNIKPDHKRSLMRNQAILLIEVDGLEAGLDEQRDRIVDLCTRNGAREVRQAADQEAVLFRRGAGFRQRGKVLRKGKCRC